jgi:protein involved in polysaccharide export with SLBB domain
LARDPAHNVLLKEFDTLVVRPIPESAIGWAVELKGEVKHPGVYTIQRGERLSSVLRRAGGLSPRAYPKGAIFIRESVKKAQQEHLHKLAALHNLRLSMESTALALGGLDQPQAEAQKELVATLRTVPEQLVQHVTLGRMVVRVDSPEKLEGTPDDLVLEPGDSLEIPPVPLTVSVLGNVRHPTALLYREGEEAMSYVRQAGGLTPDADWENAYLIKADGSAVALSGGNLSNHLDPAAEGLARIEPGDAIVVPPKVEVRTRPAPTWQAVPDYSEAETEASRGKGR